VKKLTENTKCFNSYHCQASLGIPIQLLTLMNKQACLKS